MEKCQQKDQVLKYEKMNRVVIIIMFLLSGSNIVSSQTVLDKINSIKQNDDYLWDEFTHPDVDSAVVKASMWLLDQLNNEREYPMILDEIVPYIKSITTNRGNQIRAFVYLKKNDVPLLNGIPQQSNDIETDETEQIIDLDNEKVETRSFVPDIFVQRVMNQKTFSNVYKFLAEEKENGQIMQFGALKDVEDYRPFDLILFDLNSQEVLTLLSPTTNNNMRINLLTGLSDSLDNYPEDMVAVIWYLK